MAAPPDEPYIPSVITIHMGPPNSASQNILVSFPDYIKNVASSVLYPTWPANAIIASVYVLISFALNRIYNKFYRSQGYDFDITNCADIDQTFLYGRSIFTNISQLVDLIFNDYIRKTGVLEPLAAKFCNGTTETCEGLSLWGSVELAKRGYLPLEILKYYYGNDIDIVHNAPIENITDPFLGKDMKLGDEGYSIKRIQNYLNVISNNYKILPKISPVNGLFDKYTERTVNKFKNIFNLEDNGTVGKDTWYKMLFLYHDIKNLVKLNSQKNNPNITYPKLRHRISSLPPFKIALTLEEGSTGSQVQTLQYYLTYLSKFYPAIPPVEATGTFDQQTKNSVMAAQEQFELPVTGVIDDITYNYIYNAYATTASDIVRRVYGTARIPPFEGPVLSVGSIGDDVRIIQYNLNILASTFPELHTVLITGVYGPETKERVSTVQQKFGITPTGNVDKATWDIITGKAYESAAALSPELLKFPGFPLSYGQTDEQLQIDKITTGNPILVMQILLQEISILHKDLPPILPDGVFGTQTLTMVRAFQRLMNIHETGVVDEQTWNAIVTAYKDAIPKTHISETKSSKILSSPEISIYLEEGSTGSQVQTLQYYLTYLSRFYPSITPVASSGNFDQATKNSVLAAQNQFELSPTGIVDDTTYNYIYNAYVTASSDIVRRLYGTARIPPFEGPVLSVGSIGDDVRTIQYNLNILATAYPELHTVTLTGVYGPLTKESVSTIQRRFSLPQTGNVDKATWDIITGKGYDVAAELTPDSLQFPGYTLSLGQTDEQLQKGKITLGHPILNMEVMLQEISIFYKELPAILPDGVFGEQTLTMVRAFQKLNNLPDTGIVDEQTWNAIVNSYKDVLQKIRTPQELQSTINEISQEPKDYIYFLQVMLNSIGKKYINLPCVNLTGYIDNNDVKIIQKIQEILLLPQTGILDIGTWLGILSIYESTK